MSSSEKEEYTALSKRYACPRNDQSSRNEAAAFQEPRFVDKPEARQDFLRFDAPPCASNTRPDLGFSLRDSASDGYLDAFPTAKIERKCSLMEVDESPTLYQPYDRYNDE